MQTTDTGATPTHADTLPTAGTGDTAMHTPRGPGWVKRALRIGWKLALVAVVAGLAVYRLRFAPVTVAGAVAAEGAVVSEVMGTGTLEARVQATISPKISGLVTQVLADQGDRITKGQLLATLDDGDLRQQVEIAKADLAAIRAGVDRTAADIASAAATAAQARSSYARSVDLAAKAVSSKEDLDVATERRDVADAQLKRAQAAKVEIERQALKAEESLRYYQARLADTKITSPFDGLVIRRSREPGDIVVPGSEILKIIATEELWVSAWVDETAMSALAVGQPARVVFRSEPGKVCSGKLTRMAPLADRETREFLVDVTVKDLPAKWAIGQRAEVYIQTARKEQALLVSPQALVWRKGQPGFFVDHAGHAQWRNAVLGLRGADVVEVLQGISAGERAIWPRDPKAVGLVEGRAVSRP